MEAGQFFWENRPPPQLLTEASLHIYFLQSYLALDKRKWYLLVYRWTMDIFLDGEYIKIKHISITCSLCINKMSKTSRMHRKKKKDRKRKIRQHPNYKEGFPKTTSSGKKCTHVVIAGSNIIGFHCWKKTTFPKAKPSTRSSLCIIMDTVI